MADRARVLLFTGDGKGKTTAALGTVLRAGGHGMRAMVIQFVKSDARTGEIAGLNIIGADIMQTGLGFIPPPDNPEYEKHCQAARAGMEEAEKAVGSSMYDVIVLDEICVAVWKGLVPEKDVLALIEKAPSGICIILTGRGAADALIGAADTVTEMRMVKHGYRAGIPEQKGVEY
ncbi:MAG: cob(I)yrinic acid a,c-diamide adenosyltransferase [Syntrophales bacterium]|nr:cob(I)yrinic acid a,c-diamide adenosyltransferase [Syntrophales bacterium]MDD5233880.1 cob(I)yrinic acid a,c-diamide adenosyltransferase [Syntrophales bacterium]MDD5531478.1 cob(I)yrinic acid a,c-diamide adenosyltransferase [Syntrophales bacterium]